MPSGVEHLSEDAQGKVNAAILITVSMPSGVEHPACASWLTTDSLPLITVSMPSGVEHKKDREMADELANL